MKNLNRIISLALILALCASVLSSCFIFAKNPDNGGDNSDVTDPDGSGDNNDGESGGNTDGGNDGGNTDGGNNGGSTGGDDTGNNPDDGNGDETVDYTTYFDSRQSVLLIGQSNMAGRGFAEDVEAIEDDRILMMNASKEWVKMKEPIHFDKSAAGVGLAASFAKAFVDTFDCEIGLIPAAMGGTTIGEWAVDGDLYNNALAMAKEAQKTSEICAILWHQGESNRSNHSTYADKLEVILDSLISELGLDADKVVIITGELREISTNVSQRETFHAQLAKLADCYKNYGVADADGLTINEDKIHFDAPSLRVFGYRYFNIFKTLVTGDAYDFVDDRNHYYVGAENDPNPNNSGILDRPSTGGDSGNVGGDVTDQNRVEIEGTIVADTYVSSGEYANNNNASKTYVGAYKNASRPIFKFSFANILSDPGFQANKNNGKVEFTFTFVKGAENVTATTTASAYGFLPGTGVSDADFTKLTWNNCKADAEYAGLYRGDATFVYKDKALSDIDVRKTDTYITFILNYSDVEKFICTEEGDYYGYAVMGFDFNASGVQYASMENKTYGIPKIDFVYGGEYANGSVTSVFDVIAADPKAELYFVGKSNKDALSYAIGEEMTFDIALYADGEKVSAPYFYYTVEGEDGQTKTEGYVDGKDGTLTVKGKMSKPGTLRVTVFVCDENKTVLTKGNSSLHMLNRNNVKENLCFRGGAVAGFEDIKPAASAPDDLEEYWSAIVASCYEGDIKLQRFEELNVADYDESCATTHKLYLVEIYIGEGEFATGYLSYPIGEGKLRLKASFVSYGNTKKPKPAFSGDAAQFAICAHSYHLDDPNAAAPEDYGFDLTENQDRDTVYFKGMLIRNIMATRFLKAFIGDSSYGSITFNGETLAPFGRWQKGDAFVVDGGSQAAFQSLAITALDKDVTRASIALTWFCDLGGDNIGRFEGWNPEYTDALMYYDCCSLATLIGESVEVSISGAGLGDTTSEPTGIIALYNTLNCTASLRMYQNRSHTYNPPVTDTFEISK